MKQCAGRGRLRSASGHGRGDSIKSRWPTPGSRRPSWHWCLRYPHPSLVSGPHVRNIG